MELVEEASNVLTEFLFGPETILHMYFSDLRSELVLNEPSSTMESEAPTCAEVKMTGFIEICAG